MWGECPRYIAQQKKQSQLAGDESPPKKTVRLHSLILPTLAKLCYTQKSLCLNAYASS